MKKTTLNIALIAVASISVLGLPTVFAADSYSLDDCFRAALRQSELVGTQTELVNQAEELKNQAKAALFPTLNGVGSYQIQQAAPGGTSTSSTTSNATEQTTAKLTATQGIFHGMREYATLAQSNLNVTAAMSNRRQVATTLYTTVVTNIYTILSLEQTLRDYQEELDAYQARISDLNRFIRIGRSKESDVLSVRSAVDSLAAQSEVVRGQLSAQRETFAYLTALRRDAVIQDTTPAELKTELLDYYVKRAEDRPDVKAALDAMEGIEKNVTIARAGHFPSVDLSGDYYFKRPGVSQDQHWDALVTATIPLFAGGLINAQVRQAASQGRQAELNLDMVRRLANEDIRTNYGNYISDVAQTEKLDRATQSALLNYKAQKHDYQLGLVTNIDVLTAITSAQDAKRALDIAKFQTKLDFIKLEASAALRPLQNGGDFKYE